MRLPTYEEIYNAVYTALMKIGINESRASRAATEVAESVFGDYNVKDL